MGYFISIQYIVKRFLITRTLKYVAVNVNIVLIKVVYVYTLSNIYFITALIVVREFGRVHRIL